MNDSVTLQSRTAEGISYALDIDVYRQNDPAKMAWLIQLLRFVEDKEKFFPHGKWATIQEIQRQVETCAKEYVALLARIMEDTDG